MAGEKLENVKCTVVAATRVLVRNEDRSETSLSTAGKGYLVMEVDKQSRDDIKAWLQEWVGRPAWRATPVSVSLKKWYKSKTLDQLALLWSLVKVMSLEQEGKHDRETMQSYYLGLLEWYAPRVKARLPDGREAETMKTASQMNTSEMSAVIEGAFRELSLMGVHLGQSSEVKNYYIEWRTWRGRMKKDGMEESYKSVEDYRARVPFCEATLQPLGEAEGHMAHIVSKGAGGESFESWNFLHLCAEVHIGLQHTQGWVEMLETYPHLMGKVNVARKRHGMPAVKKPIDLYDDIGTEGDVKVVEGEAKTVAEDPVPEEAREPGSGEKPKKAIGAPEDSSGVRRLWFHPESDSHVVTSGEINDALCVAVADVPTDTMLGMAMRDLVDAGKMKQEEMDRICKEHGLSPEAFALGLF